MGDPKKPTDGNKLQGKTYVRPVKGTVTWDSEGQEGGPYHSRKLHVPPGASGLTLGRGYDMKERLKSKIYADLTSIGVPKEIAETLSKASGVTGDAARKFITDNKLADFEITEAQQKQLYEGIYPEYEKETKRLATKDDVTTKYGKTDWEKLNPAIAEVLVDMRYRGDYTADARAKIQGFVVKNDLEGFAKHLGNEANWKNVPKERFKARKALLDAAVAEKTKLDKLKEKQESLKQKLPPIGINPSPQSLNRILP